MLALSDAVRDGAIPNAEIAVVISDKPGARGYSNRSTSCILKRWR